MTGPPDAVVREYQALLKMDGVDLQFTDDAAARRSRGYCIQRRTGARSLRTLVEEICHDVMFDAPERKGETDHRLDANSRRGRRLRARRRRVSNDARARACVADLGARTPLFSFEFFPPKTDAGH